MYKYISIHIFTANNVPVAINIILLTEKCI